MELLAGVALVVALAALVGFGLGGDRLWRKQSCRFVCPRLGQPVDCEIVQDIRTGQWKEVQSCSAFADPTEITCERECTRRMNHGFLQPRIEGV